jgi:lipopolysaccharide transport system ATP-binding protein
VGAPVIRAEGLAKRFALGETRRGGNLRESLVDAASTLLGSRRRHRRATPDHLWALWDVSFEVAEGEVLGIVGANGAGKSTLLRILSRITAPSVGRAEIRGRVGSLLEVGTGFHPELTGRENVQLNGAILGMSRREIARRFDAIVDFAGVEAFLDTPVKRYSSGMRMRLAFAVAAHLEPEVLIVDEVLAVGDLAFQQRCLGKMSEVAGSGRTVLFVSHNMAAVEGLCDRALLLERGRRVTSGETRGVIAEYLARASAPMTAGAVATSGDGALRVRGLELLDEHDVSIGAVQSGQTFSVELELHTRAPLARAAVQLAINDSLGARTAVLHSGVAGGEADLPAGAHRLRCRVRDLPLVPGAYGLELKLLSGGETLLFERSAAPLLVEGGDFFGTGRLPPSGWGGRCLLHQDWTREPVKRDGEDVA